VAKTKTGYQGCCLQIGNSSATGYDKHIDRMRHRLGNQAPRSAVAELASLALEPQGLGALERMV
jgi:hypothetical protein